MKSKQKPNLINTKPLQNIEKKQEDKKNKKNKRNIIISNRKTFIFYRHCRDKKKDIKKLQF